MSEPVLGISFDSSVDDPSERRFVHLEQMKESFDPNKTVTMFDIIQMVARARAGTSAQTYGYESCPISQFEPGIFSTWFYFYAWPSSMQLGYTVESSVGAVSAPVIVEKQTEFSLIFEMTDAVELDFILKDITHFYWETNCYDINGRVIPDVSLEMDGTSTVVSDFKVFGVARIRGTKIGTRHRLVVNLTQSVPTQESSPGAEDGAYEVKMFGMIGSYNYTAYPIILGSSLRPQMWTISHVTGTVFNVKGDTVGALPAGYIDEDYECEYFSIKKEFFSGTYTTDNFARFQIEPKQIISDNLGYTDIESWTGVDGSAQVVPQGNLNMTGAVITNLNVNVIARWMEGGEEKTSSLNLAVPNCVRDILNMCDPFGDEDGDGIPNYLDPDYGGGNWEIILNPEKHYILYYSICDGTPLDLVEIDPSATVE